MNKKTKNSYDKRHVKVLKLRILKPADDKSWDELGQLLREARYRVFRLANLAVSEAYLNFHLWREKKLNEYQTKKISQLNRELRDTLSQEGKNDEELIRFSKTGALPDTITGALSQYKIGAIKNKSKWSEVIRGKSSLPTFRSDMAIPVRCDKSGQRRLQETSAGEVELELMICTQPYPKVLLATGKGSLGDGAREILERLLENKDQSNDKDKYRQRCFEIKQDKFSKKWFLSVIYDFTACDVSLNQDHIVGVDLGVSCPVYVAINNGHARLGYRQFKPLMARLRSLQNQTIRRRREIQRGGNTIISEGNSRSGHGRKRKLLPIEKLQGRIDRAYTTLNHQISASIIKFAKNNGAGVIQIEDLVGLQNELRGTFLGERWRYAELQKFIEYKAKESGIEVRKINPQYTSRRCSQCGFINMSFTFEYRQDQKKQTKSAKFECPQCKYDEDADYNAARNLATVDIENIIKLQLARQGLNKNDH